MGRDARDMRWNGRGRARGVVKTTWEVLHSRRGEGRTATHVTHSKVINHVTRVVGRDGGETPVRCIREGLREKFFGMGRKRMDAADRVTWGKRRDLSTAIGRGETVDDVVRSRATEGMSRVVE